MNMRRLSAVPALLALFLVPVLVLSSVLPQLAEYPFEPATLLDGSFVKSAEVKVREHIPYRTQLSQFAIDFRYLTGLVEQNGIYISDEMLLVNLAEPDDAVVEQNREGVLAFIGSINKPTYMVLLPTACAIKQQQLPSPYAPLYNQRSFIESEYEYYSGQISVIDAYSQLFAKREEYIYYNTQDNLTAYGGYEVYSVIARRMGLSLRTSDMFEIEHVNTAFTGNIYDASPYKSVRPDMLSVFRFSRNRREYTVTHTNAGQARIYHTLYPKHAGGLGDEMNIFLGGLSDQIHISTVSSFTRKLLVFGDSTIQSYLPFLAIDYGEVMYVNLATISPEAFAGIAIERYDQVLFAYSLSSYFHTAQLGRLPELLNARQQGEV